MVGLLTRLGEAACEDCSLSSRKEKTRLTRDSQPYHATAYAE